MIGIVVATHGSLATGVKSALSLLAGEPEQFEAVELLPGMNPEDFKSSLEQAIDRVDSGDGALVLVDIFGGTPSNTVCRLLFEKQIECIAGVNLPMVIEATFARSDSANVGELAGRVKAAGSDALVDIRQKMVAIKEDEEEF